MQNTDVNKKFYTHLTFSSTTKKRFFSKFLNLLSYIRLPLLKHDRVSKFINIDSNQDRTAIQQTISRCRRSSARYFSCNPSKETEKDSSSSKCSLLKKRASINSSITTLKSDKKSKIKKLYLFFMYDLITRSSIS